MTIEALLKWALRVVTAAMGAAYIVAGLLLLITTFDPFGFFGVMRYPFGILLIVYGAHRFYRGIKRSIQDA